MADTLSVYTIEVGPEEDTTEDLIDTLREHPDLVYFNLRDAVHNATGYKTAMEVRVRTFEITRKDRCTIIPARKALVPNKGNRGYTTYTPEELGEVDNAS